MMSTKSVKFWLLCLTLQGASHASATDWPGCVQQICANSKGRVSDLGADLKRVKEIQSSSSRIQEFRTKYGVEFRKIDEKILAVRRQSLLNAIDYIAGKTTKVTPFELYTFNRGLLFDQLYNEFNHIPHRNAQGREYLEPTFYQPSKFGPGRTPSPLFKQLSTALEEEIIQTLNFESQAVADLAESGTRENQSMSDFIRGVASGSTLHQAVKNFAADGLKDLAKIARLPLIPKGIDVRILKPLLALDLLKAAANGDDIETEKLPHLIFARRLIAEAKVDFGNPDVIAAVNRVAHQILNDPKARELLLQEYLDKLSELDHSYIRDGGSSVPWLTIITDQCAAAYAVELERAPSVEQLNVARKIEHQARINIRRFITTTFPGENPGRVEQIMKRWNFRYPPLAHEIDRQFSDVVQSYSSYADNLQPTMNPGDFYSTGSWISSFCNERKESARAIRDAAETVEGWILVGWESVLYPEMGMQIFGHEMGHLLSAAIRDGQFKSENRSKFDRARTCLKQKHTFEPNVDTTEEDWADLVSIQSQPKNLVNMWCSAYQPGSSDYDFYDIKTSSQDPHASILFRLLHIDYGRKAQLPPSCQGSVVFEKCL